MTPSRYAVEYLRTGFRVEFLTEPEAIKYYEKLRKNNTSAWIVNIYE